MTWVFAVAGFSTRPRPRKFAMRRALGSSCPDKILSSGTLWLHTKSGRRHLSFLLSRAGTAAMGECLSFFFLAKFPSFRRLLDWENAMRLVQQASQEAFEPPGSSVSTVVTRNGTTSSTRKPTWVLLSRLTPSEVPLTPRESCLRKCKLPFNNTACRITGNSSVVGCLPQTTVTRRESTLSRVR